MGSIFISHSSHDNVAATRVSEWLRGLGYDDVFFDASKDDGIAPGMNWKSELFAAMKRAQIALLLMSDHWLASVWCNAEYAAAVMNGKQIIPAIISPPEADRWDSFRSGLQARLGDVQFADLTRDWNDGLSRLETVLGRSRITPEAFPVQHGAAPYKGLSAYSVSDAGLYYGRQRETQELFELLRQLTAEGSPRLVLLIGASGAGKSSLLRAGLWPQLSLRPNAWLPIEPIIPEENNFRGVTPILAVARALAETFGKLDSIQVSPADVLERLTGHTAAEEVAAIVHELRTAAGASHATLVFGIDQGEELLRAHKSQQSQFISVVKQFMTDRQSLVVLTIRADTFDEMQESRLIEEVPFTSYVLPRMPLTRIPEIIRDPARRVGLVVDPALVERATEDAMTGDALPLLSFSLERLWRDHGRDGDLTLIEYEKLAGTDRGERISPIENSVAVAAEAALSEMTPSDEAALGEAFVPGLVDLTEALVPSRRRANWESMPQKARPLLQRLVEARLLKTERADPLAGEAGHTLEVAHEALLRRWPLLARRVEAAIPDLRFAQDVERAATDFARAGREVSRVQNQELRHSGRRLAHARTLARQPAWRQRFGESAMAYLRACANAETSKRVRVAGGIAALIVALGGIALYFRSDYYQIRTIPGSLSVRLVTESSGHFDAIGYHLRSLTTAGYEGEALRIAQSIASWNEKAIVMAHVASALYELGRSTEASALVAGVLKLIDETAPGRTDDELASISLILASAGERNRGAEMLRKPLDMKLDAASRTFTFASFNVEGLVHAAAALQLVDEARTLARAASSPQDNRQLLGVIAQALARRGDVGGALATLDEARRVKTSDSYDTYESVQEDLAYSYLALAMTLRGDKAGAIEQTRRMSNKNRAVVTQFAMALALKQERDPDAEGVLQRALADAKELPYAESAAPVRAVGAYAASRMGYPGASDLVEESRVEAARGSAFVKTRVLTFVARAESHLEGVFAAMRTAADCEATQNLEALSSVWIEYWKAKNPAVATLFANEPWHLVAQFH